jgi:hypothetical protein
VHGIEHPVPIALEILAADELCESESGRDRGSLVDEHHPSYRTVADRARKHRLSAVNVHRAFMKLELHLRQKALRAPESSG